MRFRDAITRNFFLQTRHVFLSCENLLACAHLVEQCFLYDLDFVTMKLDLQCLHLIVTRLFLEARSFASAFT